jgi:hypothetical protein
MTASQSILYHQDCPDKGNGEDEKERLGAINPGSRIWRMGLCDTGQIQRPAVRSRQAR